uniref:Uncharacterized protein n=1 Tax=Anguilla anguilla TaxID=7936 RepID=A0A0E9X9E0_ANGAN
MITSAVCFHSEVLYCINKLLIFGVGCPDICNRVSLASKT